MKNKQSHKKSKHSSARSISTVIFLVMASAVTWNIIPNLRPHANRPMPSDKELSEELAQMIFFPNELPNFTKQQMMLARFGKKLFFDKRFSANGEVACANCHQPKKAFSDGLPFGQGLGQTVRRTPSIINSFASSWFFWDGRADSLASQALGPIEHPMEHGISRTHVARLLRDHYKKEYEEHFGKFPNSLMEKLPAEAKGQEDQFETSAKMSAYTLASLDSFRVQDSLLVKSSHLGIAPAKLASQLSDFTPKTPKKWVEAWEKLALEQQNAINKVFANFGKAVAQFETGIIAVNSPFDQFAKKVVAGQPIKKALGKGFGEDELEGLKLFVGPGNCTSCHMGPHFSDQQFHNIGLPLRADLILKEQDLYIDVGRSMGVLMVKASPFNCKGGYINEQRESCRELPWLDSENLELVGAFKTPSLRNVAMRAPYLHDGRFENLSDVLKHYNEMPEDSGIGHREETLLPLKLTSKQLMNIESFLKSLSSSVTDLSEDPKALSQLN